MLIFCILINCSLGTSLIDQISRSFQDRFNSLFQSKFPQVTGPSCEQHKMTRLESMATWETLTGDRVLLLDTPPTNSTERSLVEALKCAVVERQGKTFQCVKPTLCEILTVQRSCLAGWHILLTSLLALIAGFWVFRKKGERRQESRETWEVIRLDEPNNEQLTNIATADDEEIYLNEILMLCKKDERFRRILLNKLLL